MRANSTARSTKGAATPGWEASSNSSPVAPHESPRRLPGGRQPRPAAGVGGGGTASAAPRNVESRQARIRGIDASRGGTSRQQQQGTAPRPHDRARAGEIGGAMARVVILGAGVSGHTAALRLRRLLGKRDHDVVVVTPNANWNWIPSNIWVGVGKMPREKVVFPLAPVYRKMNIELHQARATAIRPEGDDESVQGAVDIEYTAPGQIGQTARLRYDYLINATGPKLNFAATPGLGPDANSLSVCTADHAAQAAVALGEVIERMRAGQPQTLVIGVGHGMCTCEGAAFEYTFNVEHELRESGVRDLAEVIYLTNERELGDFGVGGMTFEQQGFVTTSAL